VVTLSTLPPVTVLPVAVAGLELWVLTRPRNWLPVTVVPVLPPQLQVHRSHALAVGPVGRTTQAEPAGPVAGEQAEALTGSEQRERQTQAGAVVAQPHAPLSTRVQTVDPVLLSLGFPLALASRSLAA